MNKVSIIIPVYNGEDTIERAINSCINQSYSNIEILVINNQSIDSTSRIVEMIEDVRVKLFSPSFKGRSKARNYGIEQAKGSYILFLDADDEISKDRIEIGVTALNQNLAEFGHAVAIKYLDSQKGTERIQKINYNEKLLKLNNPFPINSILLRNENLIPFDKNMEFNEDWFFFIQNLKNKTIIINNDFIGGKVYVTGKNTMKDIRKMISTKLDLRIHYKKSYFNGIELYFDNLKLLIYLFAMNPIETKKKYTDTFPILLFVLEIITKNKSISSKLNQIVNNRFSQIYYY